MPNIQLDNVNLYFEIYGSEYQLLEKACVKKPTIVVVHGGPGIDHHYYEAPFWQGAEDSAQIILIDQRGNGRSIDTEPSRWNLRQWAKDIYDFCHALSLEKPFIYGCSMGGWVAQLYASLYPDQPAGIILTDTEAYLDIDAIISAYTEKGGKEIGALAYNFFHNPSSEAVEQYFNQCIPLCSINPIPDSWMERSIQTFEVNQHFKENELQAMNLLESNKNITAPVLYISNTINPLHLCSTARKTADAMVNAQVEFIALDNIGLVAMDAKEIAHRNIKSFLRKHFNNA